MKKRKETNFKKREFFKPAKEVDLVLYLVKDKFVVIGVVSKVKIARLRAAEFIALNCRNF